MKTLLRPVAAHLSHLVTACVLLGLAPPALSALTDNGDGTVTDTITGLMWDQCVSGRTTTDTTCDTGSATAYTWAQALGAAVTANNGRYKTYNDWRLPNVAELESLLDISRIDEINAAIDGTKFPNTPPNLFWSSSTAATFKFGPGYALYVDFLDGRFITYNGDTFDSKVNASFEPGSGPRPVNVRLVRGGQSLASFDLTPSRLPDTGLEICYNDAFVADTKTVDGVVVNVIPSDPASIARDAGSNPRQDCRYGRDPAAAAGAAKTGAGAKGLDYTKIANNGSIVAADTGLGANPSDWACTQDNITGLMWEVKTVDGGLRDMAHKYYWYSSNDATNGGIAGTASLATNTTCETAGRCDTEKFVADVNAANLCGHADWRMPTLRELLTLALYDRVNPSIDSTYFLNTQSRQYWSASSSAGAATKAWAVYFSHGGYQDGTKSTALYHVRLVRGGQF